MTNPDFAQRPGLCRHQDAYGRRLAAALLLLRLGVFIVFFLWTLDKFVRPMRHKDFLPQFGAAWTPVIGTLELVVIVLFLFGVLKLFSYGVVLVLHLISTASAYHTYLTPFHDRNLLYFASWPMLAACVTLFLLREEDTLLTWAHIRHRFGARNRTTHPTEPEGKSHDAGT